MEKFSVVVVLCLCLLPTILCMSEEMIELGKQLHSECQGQTGVDEAVIDGVKEKRGFPDDDKFKCYIKCIMTEMAVVDDEGVLDIEAAIAVIPDEMKDLVEPVIKKCGSKKGSDPCDSVYLTHKCYYETDPKNYFIV